MIKKLILTASVCLTLGACSQAPATFNTYGVEKGAGSVGVHTVLEGDTLYSIAKNYKLPMREIITLNKLRAPYIVSAGYRLKLPPPNEYQVRAGDTVQSVARLYEVSPNRLASLNGLSPPYHLTAGQAIRLPTPSGKYDTPINTSAKTRSAAVAKPSQTPWANAAERKVLDASAAKGSPVPPSDKMVLPPTKPAVPASASATSVPSKVKTAAISRAKVPEVPKMASGKFMRPVDGKTISSYGAKKDGLHNDGINIKAVRGTPVRAAQNGVVVYNGDDLEGYGNLVLIRHENKLMSAYAHLNKTLVKRGAKVVKGQSIGTVGSTGQVDTPQLHFEIRKGSTPLNPAKYL